MTASRYNNYTLEELRCHCDYDCGKCVDNMVVWVMVILVAMRLQLGFALPVTSSIRCDRHNKDVSKSGLKGVHTTGMAVDIATTNMTSKQIHQLIKLAFEMGVTGVGIGDGFIHLDWAVNKHRPALWGY